MQCFIRIFGLREGVGSGWTTYTNSGYVGNYDLVIDDFKLIDT